MSQVVRAKAEERTVTAGLWKKYSVKKMKMLTSFAHFTFRIKCISVRAFI